MMYISSWFTDIIKNNKYFIYLSYKTAKLMTDNIGVLILCRKNIKNIRLRISFDSFKP